jgi:hypothetical protein
LPANSPAAYNQAIGRTSSFSTWARLLVFKPPSVKVMPQVTASVPMKLNIMMMKAPTTADQPLDAKPPY